MKHVVRLILSFVTMAVGVCIILLLTTGTDVLVFGFLEIRHSDYGTFAWWAAIVISACLFTYGIVTVGPNIDLCRAASRARDAMAVEDFFRVGDDGVGYCFDFKAFLASLGARDVYISEENGVHRVDCRIGRYRFSLRTRVNVNAENRLEVDTMYRWREGPIEEGDFTAPSEGSFVRSRNGGIFARNVFDAWCLTVAHTAVNYKRKPLKSPSEA